MADEPIRFQFTYDGVEFDFEPTEGEIEDLEDAFDKPLAEINFTRNKAIRMIVAFGLARRERNRTRQDILADLASLPASEWMRRVAGPVNEPDPTKAEAEAVVKADA